jgi:hypothetical protein
MHACRHHHPTCHPLLTKRQDTYVIDSMAVGYHGRQRAKPAVQVHAHATKATSSTCPVVNKHSLKILSC